MFTILNLSNNTILFYILNRVCLTKNHNIQLYYAIRSLCIYRISIFVVMKQVNTIILIIILRNRYKFSDIVMYTEDNNIMRVIKNQTIISCFLRFFTVLLSLYYNLPIFQYGRMFYVFNCEKLKKKFYFNRIL